MGARSRAMLGPHTSTVVSVEGKMQGNMLEPQSHRRRHDARAAASEIGQRLFCRRRRVVRVRARLAAGRDGGDAQKKRGASQDASQEQGPPRRDLDHEHHEGLSEAHPPRDARLLVPGARGGARRPRRERRLRPLGGRARRRLLHGREQEPAGRRGRGDARAGPASLRRAFVSRAARQSPRSQTRWCDEADLSKKAEKVCAHYRARREREAREEL